MTAPPVLVALIAAVGTLLGSMSGGSSSLLTTPTWIALGFPLPTAVGADKIAGAFWALVGSRNSLRGRSPDRRLLAGMTVAGLGGALVGTLVTTGVRSDLLERVVGGAIVVVVLVVAFLPRFGVESGPARISRGAAVLGAVPLGFYEGLFGSGNSVFSSILLSGGRGLDLPAALGHYYLMASAWCGLAAVSYWTQGTQRLALALPATVGAVAGGYLGSRIGARRGGRFVRTLFVLAGLGLGGKLLLGL